MVSSRAISFLLIGQAFLSVTAHEGRLVRNSQKSFGLSANGRIQEAGLLEGQTTEDLLTEVETMVQNKDPKDRPQIEKIKELVEAIFPDVKKNRDDEEAAVKINLEKIAACNTKSTEDQASIKKNSEKDVVDQRASHATCREQEQGKEKDRDEHCKALDDYLAKVEQPSAKPQGRKARVKWVKDLSVEWCPKKEQVQVKDDECKKHEHLHSAHKTDCDTKQATFESHFCSWRTELSDECRELTTCYGEAVKGYEEHKKVTESLVEKLKVEWKSLRKIRCYVDVWLKDQDTKTADASQYEKCKALDPTEEAEKELTIDYGKVPAKETCDLKPVSIHPGSQQFPETEYSKFTKYVKSPVPCIAA